MKRKPDPPAETPSEPFVLDTPIDGPRIETPLTEVSPADLSPVDPPPTATEAERGEVPSPRPQRPGILAPLLGGALAAVAGFALAEFDAFGLRSAAPVDLAPLQAQQAGALADLKAQQAAGLAALTAQIDDLSKRLAAVETLPPAATLAPAQIDALDRRLQAIEALPPGSDAVPPGLAATVADLERRVAALGTADTMSADLFAKVDAALAQLAEAEATATARATEAAAIAETIRQRSTLDALRAAADSGAPFDSQLAAITDPDLQAALAGVAATGLAPLSALQESFPDAARAALNTAREADPSKGWGTRLVDFLAAQTGARSLTPRQGTDPDAVLSRADAALREGRLADALAEIASLEPAVAAPLADWAATATLRLQAEQALDAAAARLPRLED